MGFKLNRINFVLVLVILSSCSVSRELREERKQWNFNNWENEYKDRAFCLCIIRGYENKKIEHIIKENDKSFYNPLGIAIFDKSLEPIIHDEIKKIRLDSINSIGSYPEDLKTIYQKRRVFDLCLKFYKGKELDSLVKEEKKEWKKIPSIINEIWKEIPTY